MQSEGTCEAAMVDPISNTTNVREIGQAQNRPQASPVPPVPGAVNPETNLTPDQRVEVMQAAVEKLIKKGMPANSKLQIDQDKETGTYIYRSVDPKTGEVLQQWPPEQLLKLRDYLHEMAGLFVDKQV
jgi:flagellar protein FlaG